MSAHARACGRACVRACLLVCVRASVRVRACRRARVVRQVVLHQHERMLLLTTPPCMKFQISLPVSHSRFMRLEPERQFVPATSSFHRRLFFVD